MEREEPFAGPRPQDDVPEERILHRIVADYQRMYFEHSGLKQRIAELEAKNTDLKLSLAMMTEAKKNAEYAVCKKKMNAARRRIKEEKDEPANPLVKKFHNISVQNYQGCSTISHALRTIRDEWEHAGIDHLQRKINKLAEKSVVLLDNLCRVEKFLGELMVLLADDEKVTDTVETQNLTGEAQPSDGQGGDL